jgi:hypothetical protein
LENSQMQDNFHRPDDHEAKMARADLFKCAQYSFKLFKMISEDQELEGWVQAKITKAADYIASVYHYMEYEMKISEYGDAIENADMYSESIRRAFQQKLTEAKVQAKKAKAKAEEAEKALDEEKSSTGGEITRGRGFTRHTHNPDRFSDEPHAEPASKAKSKSAAEKAGDKAHDKAQEKDSKSWGKANPGKQTIMKGGVKTTNEGAKPDFLDMDKDGNKKEPMKKAVADKKAGPKKGVNPFAKVKEAVAKCNHTDKGEKCPVHGLKECGMYEAAKWRDPKYKDKLYTQEPRDPDDYYQSDDDYYNPKPDNYPGAKHKIGGSEYDHNDPLRTGYGRHGVGSLNTHGKRKGLPSRDHITSLNGSIKDAHGKHPHPNLPEAAPRGQKSQDSAKKVSEGDKFNPLKHVKNPTQGEKTAAKDVKRGSYADRAAVLKSAEADGRLKKESTGDYSAKKAAAGKDIGKPGKNFAKIEKSAGGGEKGKKIAGAVLAKLRAKG